MSVKATVKAQYARIIDANALMSDIRQPTEGWIKTMREALGMSVQDLADRMGIGRNSVYLSEKTERKKSISIGQMERIAEAMGGKFVYAIVPAGSVENMIEEQARASATRCRPAEQRTHGTGTAICGHPVAQERDRAPHK